MDDRPTPIPASFAVPWERVEKFVGQISHDVRNGLNTLELQLTYLSEICIESDAAAECRNLRVSLSAVARQLQALRLSTCAPSPLAMDYPAQDFFEDLRERFERLENAATAKAAWDVHFAKAAIAIDPELTMTALLEVLGNVIRFGDGAADFSFSARPEGSDARITLVERKRAGTPLISTADWGRQPLQSSRRSAYGLGLFRATRVLEAQGGSIAATYSAPDATLTTAITLPLAAAA